MSHAQRWMTAAGLTVLLAGCGGAQAGGTSSSTTPTAASVSAATTSSSPSSTALRTTSASVSTQPAPPAPPLVRTRVLPLVDHTRSVQFPGQPPQPRALTTIVRYPARATGALPLVVFGHGFAVTPRPYAALLTAWARAGYVVAAPVFPLENAGAPGGPNEADLVNQPRDMTFVITQLLRASAAGSGPLRGRIDPHAIAVTGQSDGGETALAVAYDRRFLDPRVDAAVILSGARIPGIGRFVFPVPSPPLLATQGTADTINPPSFTHDFFDAAPRPKFLLNLLGAPHLPPYTSEQPQLGIVERVTVGFLDRYLKRRPGAASAMLRASNQPGLASLAAAP